MKNIIPYLYKTLLALTLSLPLIFFSSCEGEKEATLPKLKIKSYDFAESDTIQKFKIQASYPQIDSANEIWQNEVNVLLLMQVKADADSFKRFIQDFDPSFLRECEGNYKVHANSSKLLSISQRFIWAVPGTSILLGEVKGLTVRRKDGQRIELKDCFKSEDFETVLLNQINAEVEKQFGIEVCKKVESSDIQAFVLEKAGMRFFLDIYNGSHACQQVEAVIPFEKLEKILDASVKAYFA